MAMALENILLRIGKQKFTAVQKIIPKVGYKLMELLRMVQWNSTDFEIYAYNLDMSESLVFRVFILTSHLFFCFLNCVKKEMVCT